MLKTMKQQYNKTYYTKHHDKIIAKLLEYRHCACCNKDIQYVSMVRHKQTKMHIENEAKHEVTTPNLEVTTPNLEVPPTHENAKKQYNKTYYTKHYTKIMATLL